MLRPTGTLPLLVSPPRWIDGGCVPGPCAEGGVLGLARVFQSLFRFGQKAFWVAIATRPRVAQVRRQNLRFVEFRVAFHPLAR